MEDLIEGLRLNHPGLVFSNRIGLLETRRSLINHDTGLDLDHRSDRIEVDLIFREEGSTAIFDGFLLPSQLDRYDLSTALEEYGSLCGAFANRVSLPEGPRHPVVFSRETVTTALRKFYMDMNGVSFASGASLLSGRTGEKIFSKDFTLLQCHDPERGCGCFFDTEGVVTDGFLYPLIEDGVLRAAYTDKRTAAMFGLPLTGSAGGAYDGVPQLAPSPLRVGRSSKTLSQLLEGQPGILLMLAEGGEYKPDGGFATPVQTAMLHDGTRMIGRLPELRVSSSIFSMFGEEDFRGVSSDSITELADNPCLVVDMEVEEA
jgi:PmbA protein